jgi:hypothetical protein
MALVARLLDGNQPQEDTLVQSSSIDSSGECLASHTASMSYLIRLIARRTDIALPGQVTLYFLHDTAQSKQLAKLKIHSIALTSRVTPATALAPVNRTISAPGQFAVRNVTRQLSVAGGGKHLNEDHRTTAVTVHLDDAQLPAIRVTAPAVLTCKLNLPLGQVPSKHWSPSLTDALPNMGELTLELSTATVQFKVLNFVTTLITLTTQR